MTHRERFKAIMHYEKYDRIPVLHFGFWDETLQKWRSEGHLNDEDIENVSDGSAAELALSAKLGFDYNYYTCFQPVYGLYPSFDEQIIGLLPDGSR